MNELVLILIILSIINEGLILYLLIRRKNKKQIKENYNNELDKAKVLLEDKSIEKINDVVEELIKTAVDRYMVLNVNFNSDAYLNSEGQRELSLYVLGSIRENMTPAVKELIGLIQDISTEEKLNNYLELQIKMYILAVVVKTNQ